MMAGFGPVRSFTYTLKEDLQHLNLQERLVHGANHFSSVTRSANAGRVKQMGAMAVML